MNTRKFECNDEKLAKVVKQIKKLRSRQPVDEKQERTLLRRYRSLVESAG